MKIKFLNFPKIFFFIVSLLTFIQLSFASFKGELKLDEDKNSNNFYIMSKLNSLLNIRSKQPAFHPNATQFTLNLGDKVFGLWRQDKKRKQSIFSIYNVTSKSVKLSLQKINLIETEKWIDLISGQALNDIDDDILLKPYQSLWVSNYNPEK